MIAPARKVEAGRKAIAAHAPPQREAAKVNAPRVSVVIPTYRRTRLLRRCLDAVCRAAVRLEPASVEIIVADDGADEDTRRVVQSFASREGLAVCYVTVTGRHGPAAARNTGWRVARGEIIAFTDDDCVPQPNWLVAGVAAFSSPEILGVSGQIHMPLRTNRPTDYERNSTHLAHAEFVTANCFYRRAALESVGGFDERFRVAWREDSDLYFSLLERTSSVPRNGAGPTAFVRAPEAVVLHPIRPASWGVSIRQQSRNRYNALLYKKHARLYRERLAPVTPWQYYGIVGGLLMAVLGVLLGRRRLAALGALVWFGLTGRFLARRLQDTSRKPGHIAEMVITSILIPPVALYWRARGAIEHRARFL